MKKLRFYWMLLLLFLLPVYLAMRGPTAVAVWQAFLVSGTVAPVVSVFVSLRSVVSEPARALQGWRGIVSYGQVPLFVGVTSVLVYRSSIESVAWSWYGLFVASIFLGNPAQVILASGAPAKTAALTLMPWPFAISIALLELFSYRPQEEVALGGYSVVIAVAILIYRNVIVEIRGGRPA